jgi:hypothetical protein
MKGKILQTPTVHTMLPRLGALFRLLQEVRLMEALRTMETSSGIALQLVYGLLQVGRVVLV